MKATDTLQYYGLYQFTTCPMRPENFEAPDLGAG